MINSPVPDFSVIIPVVERYGDLRKLFSEYAGEFRRLEKQAEFIFVVDDRQRHALPVLREIQDAAEEEVFLVLLAGQFGESAALTVGLNQARADTVVTLASYFQVDPGGLSDALERLQAGADLVVGCRFPRRDSLFNRLQSKVFHWIVGTMTSSHFKDLSSGFRILRRGVAEDLNVYGGLHRFIPIIAARSGFRVEEIDLRQRSEDLKTRYYGIAVYLKRILDIATVLFLLRFTRRPLRFFGSVGLVLSGLGAVIVGYLGVYRLLGFGAIADRPLLLLGVLLIVLGVQILSLGLIGEIIIFTHAGSIKEYRIVEVISRGVATKSRDTGN